MNRTPPNNKSSSIGLVFYSWNGFNEMSKLFRVNLESCLPFRMGFYVCLNVPRTYQFCHDTFLSQPPVCEGVKFSMMFQCHSFCHSMTLFRITNYLTLTLWSLFGFINNRWLKTVPTGLLDCPLLSERLFTITLFNYRWTFSLFNLGI